MRLIDADKLEPHEIYEDNGFTEVVYLDDIREMPTVDTELIDKKELKEWIENWFETNKYYHPYSKSNNIPIIELYDILEQMPTIATIDTERHGYWISVDEEKRFYLWKCSECHTHFAALVDRYHYCPNCGAKMDLVDQEAEE